MMNLDKKLLIIVGPTASGKTKLALKLAKRFNAELISVDSRQIYRGMDIGTGKDLPESSNLKSKNSKLQLKFKNLLKTKVGTYNINGISIWGLDLINPNESFSVSQWLKFAKTVIEDVWKRQKLPIIVGGTGFWIKALLKGIEWGNIKPDAKLRKILVPLSVLELQKRLKRYPEKFQKKLSQSDWRNPRRLIRRIEIAEFFKQTSSKKEAGIEGIEKQTKPFIIRLEINKSDLKRKIRQRIKKRLKQGLLKEIKTLLQAGFSFDDSGLNTLGYKEFKEFFQTGGKDKQLLTEAIDQWEKDEIDYSRRQETWLNKYFKT